MGKIGACGVLSTPYRKRCADLHATPSPVEAHRPHGAANRACGVIPIVPSASKLSQLSRPWSVPLAAEVLVSVLPWWRVCCVARFWTCRTLSAYVVLSVRCCPVDLRCMCLVGEPLYWTLDSGMASVMYLHVAIFNLVIAHRVRLRLRRTLHACAQSRSWYCPALREAAWI
ncbi:hypothetical protein BD310DRAFT_495712 [Dichomitus squalens]|uniref:Uncharacterized protein n=1 Tax=Dichomitus squalens TaxID=114155 RepID=A0A4Q9PUQ5_9APHY|nr:hypothetical protein BD310DRAFT_495712 [Dichomitus squalens]